MVDGNMTYHHTGDAPVYAPNSFGRSYADQEGPVAEGWEADGEMVRQAYVLHAEDDDWSQAGNLVRNVFDDAARDRFVATVSGGLVGIHSGVLDRAFHYWSCVDGDIGARIKAAVKEAESEAADSSSEDTVKESTGNTKDPHSA